MNSASWNREGVFRISSPPRVRVRILGQLLCDMPGRRPECACGSSAGANSGITGVRYLAPPGSIGRWAGSGNLLVAAVRVRILEITACDIQPLPSRSFCARSPILARGHNSRTPMSESHGPGPMPRTRRPHPRARRPGAAAAASQFANWHNSRIFESLIHGPGQMSQRRSPQPGIQ